MTSLARFHNIGNDLADTVAKNTLARHPQPTPEDTQWLSRCVKVAKTVAALSCELMPSWPRLDLSGVLLEKQPRQVPQVKGPSHSWVRVSTFWQCETCLRVSKGVQHSGYFDAGRLDPPPPGLCNRPPKLDPQALRQRNHRCLALACSDNALLVVCVRCKAYTSHGMVRHLAENCTGAPASNGAKSSWSSICKGRHPKRSGITVERGPWTTV